MKIMFATDSNTMESNIAKRFGHAPYYLIYDSEDETFNARTNNGHDDDHSSLVDLVNEGVTHFVIGNIGPNAFNVLKERDAKIYLARKQTAKDALNKLLDNTLEELNKPTLKRSIEDHDHVGTGAHRHHSHIENGEHEHHQGRGYGRHGGGRGLGRGMGRGQN
jgi:predicted Fe-Mo cluster-binding NifX family protein